MVSLAPQMKEKIIIYQNGNWWIAVAKSNKTFLAKERSKELAQSCAEARYPLLIKE